MQALIQHTAPPGKSLMGEVWNDSARHSIRDNLHASARQCARDWHGPTSPTPLPYVASMRSEASTIISENWRISPILTGVGPRTGFSVAIWKLGASRTWELSSPPLPNTSILAVGVKGGANVAYHADGRRGFKSYFKRESAHITLPGVSSRMIWEGGECLLAHLYLPSVFIAKQAEEMRLDADPRDLDLSLRHEEVGVTRLTDAMIREMNSGGRGSGLVLDALGQHLVILVLRGWLDLEAKSSLTGRLAPFRLRRVLAFIEANLARGIKLLELAAVAELSPMHFSRAFKASTGRAPYQWVVERRVQRAKTMIGDTDDSLAGIALACGFADQSHMTSVFRKRTGETPAKFREVRRF
jgi:AraC family transcriptional regulator